MQELRGANAETVTFRVEQPIAAEHKSLYRILVHQGAWAAPQAPSVRIFTNAGGLEPASITRRA